MEDLTLQIRTLIHHILHRHKIYRMETPQIQEILHLLKQKPSEQPHQIQQKIFRGIVQFNLVYKDNISQALSAQFCNDVSIQTKSMMHKVLHQFYFLNSIKAYEMFLPHFQQPALQSSHCNNFSGQLFDDQFERMRLHYMYYGPLSVYNCGQVPPPQLNGYPSIAPNPPTEILYKQTNKLNNQKKPLQNFQSSKNMLQDDSEIPSQSQLLKPKHNGRGRPPKNKQMQEIVDPIINQTQNIPNKSNQLQIQNELKSIAIQTCICRGKEQYKNIKQCRCGRLFHVQCNGNPTQCLICMMTKQDPYKKIASLIGQFTLNFTNQDYFESKIDLNSHWYQCLENGFDIMISCTNPKFSGICWPDDISITIGGVPILQIPALLKAHHPSHRNDASFIITPFIHYLSQNGISLDSLSFKLNTIIPQDSVQQRYNNKNDSNFLFCFFMIQQLTPETIFQKIQQTNRNSPILSPFQWPEDQQAEIDRVTITLIDTYTKQVIQCPARGFQCQHLQCFDLTNFLKLTYLSKFRQWKCPFCKGDVRNLLIDQYQLKLLNQLRNNIPKKITFYRNGRVQYHDWEKSQFVGLEKPSDW